MPGLQLYGRTWIIADDDLICPGFLEGIVRIAWFAVVLFHCIAAYVEPKQCDDRNLIFAFLLAALVSAAGSVILTLTIGFISSRGTLANPRPRRVIPGLLYARAPFLVFDLLWTLGGTIWLYGKPPDCKDKILKAAHMTVVGNWVVIAIFALIIIILSQAYRSNKSVDESSKNKWFNVLSKVFVCGCGSESSSTSARAALNDVAHMLGNHFSGTGLVFSDILAGLVLANEKEDNTKVTDPYHKLNPIPPPHKPDWMNLDLASRYIFFAAGSYGWPHFSAAYGPKACLNIWREMRCPCRNPTSGDQPAIILRDNCCYCNTAVFLWMTDPKYQHWPDDGRPELVYFDLHNDIYQIPFAVFLDHATKSVVVVIRGSLTVEDWVTDLSVVGEMYDIPDGRGGTHPVLGHKGFFEAGKFIAKKLREEKILVRIFNTHPDYALVTTGQSLGAGAAPPLALFLRNDYPLVRCFAYSPPGCVIRDTDLHLTMSTVLSIIVGDDLVAHMSMCSIDRLRRDIVSLFHSCNLPKYRILQFGCVEACGHDIDIFKEANMTVNYSKTEVLNGTGSPREETKNLHSSSIHVVDAVASAHDSLRSQSLVLPGTIMYVFQPEPKSGRWRLSWEDQINFHRIIISTSVIDHHFPFTICKLLRQAVEQRNKEEDGGRQEAGGVIVDQPSSSSSQLSYGGNEIRITPNAGFDIELDRV